MSGQLSKADRVSTGVEGLDDVLDGGLPRNRIYLVEGAPGTGKTTLALQFLLQGKREGQRCLYISLSESKDELNSVASSHGWSLEGIDLHELETIEARFAPDQEYTVLPPEEVELTETIQQVFEQVKRIKPQRVVFDSLSEIRLLARDALRYRRQILAAKQFFARQEGTILLLDDRMGDDALLESIAHGVIRLDRLGRQYGISRRFLNVLKLRGSEFRDGAHDYDIRRGGIIVFPRLAGAEYMQPPAKELVRSGIAGLDTLLGGGLERGTSVLLLGPAGGGKSNLATQYVRGALLADKGVYCCIFEESTQRFFNRAAGVGLDVKSYGDAGKLIVQQYDPAEVSPGEFVHDLRRVVEKSNTQMVLIDSLNGYLNAMPNEDFLLIQMHELLNYLNHRGVLSILTLAQHGILGSMTSQVDLSYLVDTVVLLRYFEAHGEIRRAISVIKKREGAHENTIREIRITPNGIHIGQPLREFRGVLTGIPIYGGNEESLLGGGEDDSNS